jgi:hypothetical protein
VIDKCLTAVFFNGKWRRLFFVAPGVPPKVTGINHRASLHFWGIFGCGGSPESNSNQDGVVKNTLNSNGSVTQDVYVAKEPYTKEKELMAIVRYDGDKTGVLLGTKDYMEVSTEESPEGILNIHDLNNILLGYAGTNAQFLLNQSKKMIYIVSNNAVKQLNYDTGDILYDDKGKDKIE